MSISQSLSISIEEAEKIEKNFLNYFSGLKRFKEEKAKEVKEKGYVLICKTTGHKMFWSDFKDWKDFQSKFNSEFWDTYRSLKNTNPNAYLVQQVSRHFRISSKWERMAMNAPCQGTGVICTKSSIASLFNWIVDNNYFGIIKNVAVVHDEAVYEYPNNLEIDFSKIIEDTMLKEASKYCTKVPIPAEASVGNHWIH